MPLPFEPDILPETAGLALCKMVGGELKLADEVIFARGRPAVILALKRARIAGHVGGSIDENTDFWADQLDTNGDNIGEIRLDRQSWNSLKNRWMRCKMST
ncbi:MULTISPECIES: hypothetical protein [unclassified Phaeobacter]|uniref:hypothetical protein n=1 Tax=unclassified Phaeobacter TaxID=2621772 RepID=UPI003A87B7EB